MSKTETVQGLSNSPRAREQSEAIQTTRDLQNRVGELSELLTSANYQLIETTETAKGQIGRAVSIQKNMNYLQRKQKESLDLQNSVLERQDSAATRMQEQIDQLIDHQSQTQRRVPWLILAGAIGGALIASLITCAGIWLMM